MDSVGQEIRNSKRREYFGVTLNVDPAGRRIWPPELCRRIAEASYKSHKSLENFAAEWDINPSSLSKWRMALRRQRTHPSTPPKKQSAKAESDAVPFVAVALANNTEGNAPLTDQPIEIESHELKIKIPVSARPEVVRHVIEALRGST